MPNRLLKPSANDRPIGLGIDAGHIFHNLGCSRVPHNSNVGGLGKQGFIWPRQD
jgi:hypothetical protein